MLQKIIASHKLPSKINRFLEKLENNGFSLVLFGTKVSDSKEFHMQGLDGYILEFLTLDESE